MLEPIVQLFFYLVEKIGPWGVFFALFFIPAMLIGTGDSIRENRDYRRAMKRAEEQKKAEEMKVDNTPTQSVNDKGEKSSHKSGPFTSPFAPAPTKEERSSDAELQSNPNVVPFRGRQNNR